MSINRHEQEISENVITSYSLTVSRLSITELGRATTAYFEATPDRVEEARQEYENALLAFNAAAKPRKA